MHIFSVYTLASILLRLKLSHIHRLFHPSVNMQKIDLFLFKLFFSVHFSMMLPWNLWMERNSPVINVCSVPDSVGGVLLAAESCVGSAPSSHCTVSLPEYFRSMLSSSWIEVRCRECRRSCISWGLGWGVLHNTFRIGTWYFGLVLHFVYVTLCVFKFSRKYQHLEDKIIVVKLLKKITISPPFLRHTLGLFLCVLFSEVSVSLFLCYVLKLSVLF